MQVNIFSECHIVFHCFNIDFTLIFYFCFFFASPAFHFQLHFVKVIPQYACPSWENHECVHASKVGSSVPYPLMNSVPPSKFCNKLVIIMIYIYKSMRPRTPVIGFMRGYILGFVFFRHYFPNVENKFCKSRYMYMIRHIHKCLDI